MNRKLLSLLMVAVLLISAAPGFPADETWRLPVPSGLTAGDLVIATDSSTLTNRTGINTDAVHFLPAMTACQVASGAGLPAHVNQSAWDMASRIASSIWAIARQANTTATETYWVGCGMSSWLQRTGAAVGIKINTIGMVYQVLATGTINKGLASHYFGKLATVAFANNTDINAGGLNLVTVPTLATTVQALPYLTTVTVTTPAYLPTSGNTDLNWEHVVSIAPSVLYRFYGLVVNFTRRDH